MLMYMARAKTDFRDWATFYTTFLTVNGHDFWHFMKQIIHAMLDTRAAYSSHYCWAYDFALGIIFF